jgi:hypothetical protein
MNSFNGFLVEYLDKLNKIMAFVFAAIAGATFFGGLVFNSFFSAIASTCGVIVMGVLTCGITALLININNNLQKLVDKQ